MQHINPVIKSIPGQVQLDPELLIIMPVPMELLISTIFSLLQVVLGSLSLIQAYYMHQQFRLALPQLRPKDLERDITSILPSQATLPLPPLPTMMRPRLVRNLSSQVSLYGSTPPRLTMTPPTPPTRVTIFRTHTSPLLVQG